ncbi:PTS sugar transporter subunit IIA [Desulforegula conservatrix]|uniref:PTS sugar transporter subunit IIA n=1 Tax=Desulforegula conservatrix TaxID=153026 RepID=UPI00041753D9|nr:PTS sugar transporter subunit IIA [Desulforegula conservatrix]
MIKDLSEIADYLEISRATLERWIYQGKIPVSLRDNSCEFDLRILQKWAASRKINFKLDHYKSPFANDLQNKQDRFLSDSVRIGGIFYNVEADSLESVLKKISGLAPVSGIEARDILAQSIMEREMIRSTGVGMGIAIPHIQKPMPDIFPQSFVTVCFLKNPIDFLATDGKLVTVIFLLVASSPQKHLQLLSRLSFCLKNKDFMDLIAKCPNVEEFISVLTSLELQLTNQKKSS